AAARRTTDFGEAASADVMEQQSALRVFRASANLRGVVDDVAVRNRDVEQPIIVVIEQGRAEANKRQCRETKAAFGRRISEETSSQIPKQGCHLEFVVRDDQIEAAIPVVVAEIDSH